MVAFFSIRDRPVIEPIGADQSDPIAPIDLERHVVEERPAGERFRKL